MNEEIKPKQILYYAQILPSVGIYHVLEMKVATVYDTYFAVTEKRDKHRSIMKMLVKPFSSIEVSV